MTKKHVLAAAATTVLIVGATPLSAASIHRDGTAMTAGRSGVANMDNRTYRAASRQRNFRAAQSQNGGPLGAPLTAAQGIGTAAAGTGLAIAGGAAATAAGYRYGYPAYGGAAYGPPAYGDAYASPGYRRAAYVPSGAYSSYAYSPAVLSTDIGHSFYNGFGSPAPASQDNCAVDGGYGRRDYSAAC